MAQASTYNNLRSNWSDKIREVSSHFSSALLNRLLYLSQDNSLLIYKIYVAMNSVTYRDLQKCYNDCLTIHDKIEV